MRWVKMFPGWLGWVFAAFGLSIVVGAIFEFSRTPEMTLPGVVVGAVWALVGIKAGLPLFPTASSQPDADAMASGLRKIVWRRRMSWLAMLALVAVFFVALPHVPERHVPTMFFALALPTALFSVSMFLSGCPRCGHFFYPVGRFVSPFTRLNRCQHCRLSLNGGSG
jgi:hypothetical protein